MNESYTASPTDPSAPSKSPSKIKVSFILERPLYNEINATLSELSAELGFEVTMPKFLKKTVVAGWKTQAERFRKLNTTLK